jgi:antitoxin HicB
MKLEYPAILSPAQEGGYLVQFVDLEEAFTEGDTLEEALFMAAEVLSGVLSAYLDQSLAIPKPSLTAKGQYPIAPNALVQAALLFNWARGDKSLSEIARAMNTSWAAVQRLENPKHSPNLRQLERAAAILGKRLVISFE